MSDEPEILRLFDICNRRHYGEEKYVDAAAYAALKARLAEVERERDALKHAAIEVLERWDLPLWKNYEPTAAVMHKLRDAVAAMSADSAKPPVCLMRQVGTDAPLERCEKYPNCPCGGPDNYL